MLCPLQNDLCALTRGSLPPSRCLQTGPRSHGRVIAGHPPRTIRSAGERNGAAIASQSAKSAVQRRPICLSSFASKNLIRNS